MAIYERTTWIDASLRDVWAFHTSMEGLVTLTPDWMNLRIESVTGPPGSSAVDSLPTGTDVHLSIRVFDIGPRHSWTSRIVERGIDERSGMFQDRMIDGPFPRWIHTHRFYRERSGTRIIDSVEYRLPFIGRVSTVAWPGFEVLFAYRHRRTRAELE